MSGGDRVPVRTLGVWTRRSGEQTVLEGYIDVYATNHTGAFLWAHCTEGRCERQIAEALAGEYGIDAVLAASVTGTFLDELADKGFLSWQS
ncbi:PqqD family protein [Streptomyces sp. NPDC005548]|uniref:PqqD family protein n=1 Tax=Streptomyces sp. NPDC005548 TaxID=3364724 RepID=UPI00369599BF